MNTGIQKFQAEASLPSESEFENLTRQAKIFIASGFLPASINSPEQAITIAIKGRELGIPPMQAFAHINIIQGKPAMSAELMLALCFRGCPTAVIEFIQNDNKVCSVDARRRGSDKPSRFEFNLADAQAAQLLSKDSWKKYPAAMLRARCISAMGRALFPDCLMGVSYTAEELGAEVNVDGNVSSVPATPPPAFNHATTEPIEEAQVVEPEQMTGMEDWVSAIQSATTKEEADEVMTDAVSQKMDEAGLKWLQPHYETAIKRFGKKTATAPPATPDEAKYRLVLDAAKSGEDVLTVWKTIPVPARTNVLKAYYMAKLDEFKNAVSA